ncbi:hypothetical protein AGMMS49593_07590 [Endomicrobiia bacterium]|nr:hypothetical protein AGMMS49593_07590 [Endomicrobiia bacterium]
MLGGTGGDEEVAIFCGGADVEFVDELYAVTGVVEVCEDFDEAGAVVETEAGDGVDGALKVCW